MNLQLHKVVSDITGLTGMTIIRTMVAGERNANKLAALKNRRIHSSTEQIAKALTGDYRAEHLFVLQQELTLYRPLAKVFRGIIKSLAFFDLALA